MHLKYKICVSGAADTAHCPPDTQKVGEALGAAIAKSGSILVNGATSGFPLWAAKGAKKEGGFTIGISPAETEKEHREVYQIPLEYLDMIIYTGFGYSGRNLLLTRSSDAVIVGCGRIGTFNEFTIAFEDKKPIGVLTDSGGTTNFIKQFIEQSHREKEAVIIFEKDPVVLVEKILALLHEKNY